MGEKLVPLTIYVPLGWKAVLERVAKQRRRSVSFIVRDFLEKSLGNDFEAKMDEVARVCQ